MHIVPDGRVAWCGLASAPRLSGGLLIACMTLPPRLVTVDGKLPSSVPDSGVTASELAPLIVNGGRNPLDEADRRLAALKQSLPGTDTARKRDFAERAADWYKANRDPETLKPAEQAGLLHLMGRDNDDVKREGP